MDADGDEPQGVFCSRAVAIDKEDNAADRPRPRSDHGREFCRGSLGHALLHLDGEKVRTAANPTAAH